MPVSRRWGTKVGANDSLCQARQNDASYESCILFLRKRRQLKVWGFPGENMELLEIWGGFQCNSIQTCVKPSVTAGWPSAGTPALCRTHTFPLAEMGGGV